MPDSEKRISAAAYQALRDALPVIVWYKRSFNRYLRSALRQSPELLNGLDFENNSKREIADELIDRLMDQEHTYRDVTVRLMLEIANMSSFPELQRHENSDQLLTQATDAVAELGRYTKAHEQSIVERERIDGERAAYVQQAELQRRFSDELDELKAEFLRLTGLGEEQAQQRGHAFEAFLNRLFDLFDLEPRVAYNLEREQIDGAFTFDTDDYILEAKWTKDRTSRGDADIFASKVRRKGKNALGLLVSVNELSQDAIDEFRQSTPFMTMDGADIYCVLDQRARLDDLLRRKKRHANETGECYFPANQLFE